MCFAPCLTAPFCFSSLSLGSRFFSSSLYLNACAGANRSPFVYVFPSYSSMVARTGNSTPTASTNPTPSVNNYMSPAVKMTLPQNLRTSFRTTTKTATDSSSFVFFPVHPIESWTKHDVQKWIEYCIDEYSLGDVHLNDFEMNGQCLSFFHR